MEIIYGFITFKIKLIDDNIYISPLSCCWIRMKDATPDMGATCKWAFNCHFDLLADVFYVMFMEPATRWGPAPPAALNAAQFFPTGSIITSVTRHVSHCDARRRNTAGIIAFLRGYTQTQVAAAATIACAAIEAPRAQSPRQLSLAPLLSSLSLSSSATP